MTLTRERLLRDLYVAFYDARRHKSVRSYMSRKALERVKKRVRGLKGKRPSHVLRSVNSYLGIFRHTRSYRIRRRIFNRSEFLRLGVFNAGMKKLTRNNSYKFN